MKLPNNSNIYNYSKCVFLFILIKTQALFCILAIIMTELFGDNRSRVFFVHGFGHALFI